MPAPALPAAVLLRLLLRRRKPKPWIQKEGQDSIIAMAYQPGYNTRYDYLQKKGLPLRRRD